MMRVTPSLLERQAELEMLGAAVERAGAGRGSAILVLGEAGIGKTSLVDAFLTAAAGRARVLAGACEDPLTPRALGPLRDAARSAPGGPLAGALSPDADPDLVFTAVCDELAAPPSPSVLVPRFSRMSAANARTCALRSGCPPSAATTRPRMRAVPVFCDVSRGGAAICGMPGGS